MMMVFFAATEKYRWLFQPKQTLNDEFFQKVLVFMVVVADTQELLCSILFHGINQIILSLKHFDARSIQLHRVLNFLSNFDLLLFPFIFLPDLLFLSFNKLKLLNIELLLGGDGDLAGLLLGLLADEPHHLLDLLGDIGVVHLGGGGDPDGGPRGLLLLLLLRSGEPPPRAGEGREGEERGVHGSGREREEGWGVVGLVY